MSKENKIDESKIYELGFHIVSSIAEDKIADEYEKIKSILLENKATIVKEGEIKLINLAYQIVKHVAGKNVKCNQTYFGWVKFTASANAVLDIKSEIDKNKNILRSLIVKTIDNDEISTSKIINEEKDEKIELDEEEIEIEEDGSDSEEADKEIEEKEEKKDEVDEAIDDLVK